MQLIGLTGGIGMGKSTSFHYLQKASVPAIDTDQIARELVQPGQPALADITAAFGPNILESNGQLNRQKLGDLVFHNTNARKRLESILHPRIREHWLQSADQWRRQGTRVGFVVIPLLYETRAETHFNAVVCVGCLYQTQKRRLLARGWSEAHFKSRIQSQWPIDRKMEAADFIVWTEGTIATHHQQIDRILTHIHR